MIHVNGIEIRNADNLRLSDYLVREGYIIPCIAVECNDDIVPKTQYDEKILTNGDVIEVVSFMGGG